MSSLPPPAFCSVVEYSIVCDIDATVDQVWSILIDLPSYPECRSAVMVDASSHGPLEDPTFRAGTMAVGMQMPPSMDTTKKPSIAYEQVSVVDSESHRITWGGGRVPALFRAETAIVLSATANNKTRLEMRNAFGGASGYVIKGFMGGTMRDCSQSMVDALQQRAEAIRPSS
ncbi:hypothetical protein C8Q80DRAFT_1108647 [Daedaleopsis nitida]|nr:hypothetical protein C8Q80DRAFT_1108647 [Daedaleopsis nitida]